MLKIIFYLLLSIPLMAYADNSNSNSNNSSPPELNSDELPMDTDGVSRSPGDKYYAAAMAMLRKENISDRELFYLFKRATDYRHCQSYGYLGQMLLQGRGTQKDYAKAISNFHKGTSCGDVQSLYAMGYCFENGYGAPKNINYAINLYEQASARNYAPAKFSLALIYFEDSNRTDEALSLIKEAAKMRYAPAIEYYYKNFYGPGKVIVDGSDK